MTDRLEQLLNLSHELGVESRQFAILGEGNTSCRVDDETFLVKASGSSLPTLSAEGVTRCRFGPLLELLDRGDISDDEVTRVLLESRVDLTAKKPSVEAAFHAWLLTLPCVEFVAHTHPISVNGILCSPRAGEFARQRMFPDEIVCCGGESVLVPYTDPGVPLAKAIRNGVNDLRDRRGEVPRLILLQNHGLIAPATSAAGALAATRMADKAAQIFNLAALHGGPTFLSEANQSRIAGRDDEAYRRRELHL